MPDILAAMRARKSVRKFTGVPLTDSQRAAVTDTIARAYNPFARPDILLRDYATGCRPITPGTYGMIAGCRDWLVCGAMGSEAAALGLGFTGEQAVLEATRLGLGSCWLGASFKARDFLTPMPQWPDFYSLKAVIALGNPSSRVGLAGHIARLMAGSSRRKAFDTLFTGDSTGAFSKSLEAMRIAPSSLNSQPWRATAIGSEVHFFTTSLKYMNMIDCGIGLSHFWLAERATGHEGEFFTAEIIPDGRLAYVISYRRS